MAQGSVQETEIQTLDSGIYPVLDLLPPQLNLRRKGDFIEVHDSLRKKWLLLTPEEWVRQHVVHWLLTQTRFPDKLISIERGLRGRSGGRTDVLGHDREGRVLLLVECKAATESISERTVLQALRYNSELAARFIWLTNGRIHKVLEFSNDGSLHLEHGILPGFETMISNESE